MSVKLLHGDCLKLLIEQPSNSVDAIVTDPPYGLAFMNKHWDYAIPGVEIWKECLRVLKPGGHLLSFAGTRTQHRMAVNIEDAGFEIRDLIAWVYGSGFPKSMDVSKAIDKAAGAEREVVGVRKGTANKTLCQVENGKGFGATVVETTPATDAAKQWQGWGTALKPALEPITVARKPISEKTIAANVLAHGTGGLNIDASRVPLTDDADAAAFESNHRVTERLPENRGGQNLGLHEGGWKQRVGEAVIPPGRWPANLIHDGCTDVLGAFPNAARFFYCAKASSKDRHAGVDNPGPQFQHGNTLRKTENTDTKGNNHPTVKPTDLMRYLCKLVTPPGGVVLDPFMGSGSTGRAAVMDGFHFIGIERELEYFNIATSRVYAAVVEDLL
ncbi:MAG: site-specific DNA-methyltransferase [Acidobacteria bacterium]|nr:site-specific DNA-methyltransferase [Acidobacteriota bacterium]